MKPVAAFYCNNIDLVTILEILTGLTLLIAIESLLLWFLCLETILMGLSSYKLTREKHFVAVVMFIVVRGSKYTESYENSINY